MIGVTCSLCVPGVGAEGITRHQTIRAISTNKSLILCKSAVEKRYLGWFITSRSQVRILPAPPREEPPGPTNKAEGSCRLIPLEGTDLTAELSARRTSSDT